MPLVIRDLDTMVEATLDRIIAANVGFTDKGKGSVLRVLVESIIAEMDIQYYQLGNVYGAMSIDDASGEDLDRLISILGVSRYMSTPGRGSVLFIRSTPAEYDIPIPKWTIVSTRANAVGGITEFVTVSSAVLPAGQTSVRVDIEAMEPGKLYISVGQISIMSIPVIGIERIYNDEVVNSGTDTETDESLRSRAKMALSGLGKSTNDALESAVREVSTVLDVRVLDMNRGVGTTDISVVCSTTPPPQEIDDLIRATIAKTKASGISVDRIYPSIKYIDVSITTTGDVDIAGNAVLSYFSTLGTGDTFIISQCNGKIVLAYNDGTVDAMVTSPSTNQTATTSEIIRVGVITINGVVWQLG